MMQAESINELNALRLLDCDPAVKRFSEQPCEIKYEMDGVQHRHYPDILVEFSGRKELWEIKPDSRALDPEVSSRTENMMRNLPSWGYSYRLVMASELSAQPRLANAGVLVRYGRPQISETEREMVRRAVKACGGVTWAEACSGRFGDRGRGLICRLALEGFLTVDMSSPIFGGTTFRPQKGFA